MRGDCQEHCSGAEQSTGKPSSWGCSCAFASPHDKTEKMDFVEVWVNEEVMIDLKSLKRMTVQPRSQERWVFRNARAENGLVTRLHQP